MVSAWRVGILQRLETKLQPSTILKIYSGTVLPIVEYACAIWSGGPTANLIKLLLSFCVPESGCNSFHCKKKVIYVIFKNQCAFTTKLTKHVTN